ncbi:MAG: hypothetical protein U0704_02085 [Candidatus Eisenbacteria bacterium]
MCHAWSADRGGRGLSRSRDGGRKLGAGERRALTAVLGGLSKTCGLPHLKLAWTTFAGPDDACAEALARFAWLEDLFLGVATPVQLALPRLLETRHAFRTAVRARLARNDGALAAFLRAHPEASAIPARESWAQPLRLPARLTGEQWALDALERGVVVWPGEPFELSPGAHVVVSRIVEPDVFARGLEALGRALDDQPA